MHHYKILLPDRRSHHVNKGINNAGSLMGADLIPDAEASLLHRISPLLLYHLQAIEASLKTNQYSGYFLLTWLGRVQQ